MKPTHTCLMVATTFALACSSGSSASRTDDPATSKTSDGSKQATGDATAEAAASSANSALVFPSVSPRSVTMLDFVEHRLVVGFADGNLTVLNPKTGAVKEATVAESQAVAAVPPSGELALLASSPPAIVDYEGDLVLQMNTVPSFEAATFAPKGLTLYVADKDGKVRIWGQPHSFEQDDRSEKLEDYLNRQAPDFHVAFPPISGPIVITDTNKLVVVDRSGTVRVWDPTRPSSAKQIMKVGSGARSISSAGGQVFVTSTSGQLKIANEDGSGFLPWTRDAKGGYVATGPLAGGTFYQLDAGSVRNRKTESGDDVWTTTLPAGEPCGLELSTDGGTLAACTGDFIVLLDATNGRVLGHGYRADGAFQWR